jgi:predicted nucleotidyltransferase
MAPCRYAILNEALVKMIRLEEAIQLLQNHKAKLNELGLRSIRIFGSAVRDEITTFSDIDLLVELVLPYTFDRYINAKFYLEDLLGCQVDLVLNETLRERIRHQVERKAIRVM